MTNNVNGVNGAQGTPQPGQPQLTAEQQKLVDLGIPKEVVLKGEAAIKEFAATNNITLPKPEAAAQAPVPVAGEATPDENKGLEVEKEKDPHPEAELKRANEQFRKEKDQAEVNAAKNYAAAQEKFYVAKEKADACLDAYNKASKKEKPAAKKALEDAQKELGAAREEMKSAKKKIGSAEDLAAANRFNREEAAKEEAKVAERDRVKTQRAARIEMDDYFNSVEGRKRQIEAQDEILNMDINELMEKLGGVDKSYAEKVKKRAGIKKERLEKLDALKEVRVGEEDFKQKEHLDAKGYPIVTNMSKKEYETARAYAAEQGLILPELQYDANGKVKPFSIKDDTLAELQQIFIDGAGNFGGRVDLKERRSAVDGNDDLKFRTFRHTAEKLNFDVRKSYKGAAIAAGAAVSLAMAGLPAMWNVVPAVAAEIIPGPSIETFIPGDPGLGTTGHYETIKLDDITIPGKDGSRTFKWGKYAKEASIPLILGTIAGIIADLDPSELKNKNIFEVDE